MPHTKRKIEVIQEMIDAQKAVEKKHKAEVDHAVPKTMDRVIRQMLILFGADLKDDSQDIATKPNSKFLAVYLALRAQLEVDKLDFYAPILKPSNKLLNAVAATGNLTFHHGFGLFDLKQGCTLHLDVSKTTSDTCIPTY